MGRDNQGPPLPTTVMQLLALFSILCTISLALAQHSHGSSSGGGHNMITYFHFERGLDSVWFLEWVPSSVGAVVGTCVGVFLLGILERWISALRALIELHWRQKSVRSNPLVIPMLTLDRRICDDCPPAPSFIWNNDSARGILHAGQSAIGFALMLAVMLVDCHLTLYLLTCLQDLQCKYHNIDCSGARPGRSSIWQVSCQSSSTMKTCISRILSII